MKKISGKKVIAFILSLVLSGLLGVPCALSDSVVAEGETGGTRWVLTDSGELTISGSGPMKEPHDWDPKTWAAYNGSVRKVTIEKGVTTIAPKAFAGCVNLTEVRIPDGITKVGNSAFSDCRLLKSVTLPEGVKEIGSFVFANCFALTSVVIPASVEKIGDNAFSCCGLADPANDYFCREIEVYAGSLCGVTFTLTVKQGSHAEQYAKEKELAFDNGKQRTPGRQERIYEKVDDVIRQCIKPGMTDRQKAKALHDWVVYHAYYGGQSKPGCILLEGCGYCTDYAEAYSLLLSRAGVTNTIASGSIAGGGHSWNRVYIDGAWYHVDTTFDDPGQNNGRRSGHERSKYFMMTDDQISKDHISNNLDTEEFPHWQCRLPEELHHTH